MEQTFEKNFVTFAQLPKLDLPKLFPIRGISYEADKKVNWLSNGPSVSKTFGDICTIARVNAQNDVCQKA